MKINDKHIDYELSKLQKQIDRRKSETIKIITEKTSDSPVVTNSMAVNMDREAITNIQSNEFIPVKDSLADSDYVLVQEEDGLKVKTLWSYVKSFLASFPRGHIWGLTMSNAADTANDITVDAGECCNETSSANLVLSSAITKRIDASWAVGNNQGGLNTGSVADNTWYEVHLIKRSDTGVVDVMFTTTANRTTLPSGYDLQRRIGWVRRGTGTNLQFTQIGDHFTWKTPINDVSATATATATTRTLTVPPSTIARFRASCLGNTSIDAANAIVFSEIVEDDTAPTTTNGFNSIGSGDFAVQGAGHFELRVSSTSTIRDRAITATGNMAYDISTFGFIDFRGRLQN